MRRLMIAVALGLALAGCSTAPPGQVRNMNRDTNLHGYRSYSWGKAGVSFEDYSQTVFDCTSRGVLSHVTTQQPDFDIAAADGSEDMVMDRALEARLAQQRDEMRQRHAIIDACLTERGYHRFGLTEEQLARLDTLPRGSMERRQYLHSLGSNPEVLRRQRI